VLGATLIPHIHDTWNTIEQIRQRLPADTSTARISASEDMAQLEAEIRHRTHKEIQGIDVESDQDHTSKRAFKAPRTCTSQTTKQHAPALRDELSREYDRDSGAIGNESSPGTEIPEEDIPEGWGSGCDDRSGKLLFSHRATGIVSRKHPARLSRAVKEDIQGVTRYGLLPSNYQGVVDDEDRVRYSPGDDSRSVEKTTGGFIYRHPGAFREEMMTTLKCLGQAAYCSPHVERLGLHSPPKSVQLIDFSNISGLLLIQHINRYWMERLCAEFPEIIFFIACHLLHVKNPGKRPRAELEKQLEICQLLCRWNYSTSGHWSASHDDTERLFKLTDISEEVISVHKGTARLSLIVVREGLCKYLMRLPLLLS
jgi:hypothetical protein